MSRSWDFPLKIANNRFVMEVTIAKIPKHNPISDIPKLRTPKIIRKILRM